MPFLLAEVLNFQCTTHLIGVGSLSKLALNKQVKPTIMLIQYRTKQNGKWSSWGEPSVYSKKYQTVRIKPALIKQ